MESNTVNFHPKTFGDHFKFHSNLDFSDDTVKFLPSFYKSMFLKWKKKVKCKPFCLFLHIKSGFAFNRFIQINNKPVFYKIFSLNNIDFLMQLVEQMVFLKIEIPLNMNMTYKTICTSIGCNF